MNGDISKYVDIINLKYYGSKRRKPMSMENRAAQFAPFSALTGYEDAVKEKARITDKRIILADNMQDVINEKLMIVKDNLNCNIVITCFVADDKKNGGKYVDISGTVKKIDIFNEKIYFINGEVVDFCDICNINGEIFDNYNL